MNISVLTDEYLEKQQKIVQLQRNWENRLRKSCIFVPALSALQAGVPFLMQIDMSVDGNVYREIVMELMALLENEHPELASPFKQIRAYLTEEHAANWAGEAMAINSFYFSDLAGRWGVERWVLSYLAEQAIRPYLRIVAGESRKELAAINLNGCCPCCGEPIRLAQLEEKGQKVLHCPRCYAAWLEKRTACSHCGSEDEQDVHYFSIDGDNKAQIHVCSTCNGYLKVIDTREMLNKPEPDLLDMNTIHLDMIAQERGYGLYENNEEGNGHK